MVACPKCVINNTLDSAFCKKCGAILPISIIEEEQEKLKDIVAKGMESYQTSNLEEAMMVADHAILSNPSYAEAYALKGLVHERQGAYAEALDAYETVVALNPDSTMDKIKLNQLRNAFATRQAGEPKMDRKGAALMALGVTLACAAIGGISYGVIQSSKESKPSLATNAPMTQGNPNLLANRNNTSTGQPGINVDPNRQNPAPGEVPAIGSDKNPEINSRPQTGNQQRISGSVSRFEDPGGPANPGLDSGPINPRPGPTLPKGRKDTPGNNPPEDPTPTPVTNPTRDQDPPATPNTGIMEISVSKHGSDTSGPKSSDSGTGSSGKAHQRQAQASQRNGKTAQARESYQKAIDAYQKDIDSGKGDKDAAMAGINSSKQALKNLKD